MLLTGRKSAKYSFEPKDSVSPEEAPQCEEANLRQSGRACPILALSEESRLWMPWSVPTEEAARSLRRRSFVARARSGAMVRWHVVGGPDGLPGPFDRAVFRACEWMAFDRSAGGPREIPDDLSVRIYEICERLSLQKPILAVGAIRKALRRLSQVRILGPVPYGPRSTSDAPAGPPPSVGFICPARASAPPLRIGGTRGNALLRFDPAFLKSARSGRVIPVHWELWTSFRSPVAQRLLEILSYRMSRDASAGEIRLGLQDLVELIPLKGIGRRNGAMKALEGAREELIASRYVEDAGRDGAGFRFSPGPVARAVRERARLKMTAPALPDRLHAAQADQEGVRAG